MVIIDLTIQAIYNQFRQADFEEYFAANQNDDETTHGTLTLVGDDQTHHNDTVLDIPVAMPPNDEELFGITVNVCYSSTTNLIGHATRSCCYTTRFTDTTHT
jgi:hypothetical protein